MIAAAVAGAGPSPLWYAARGAGATALVLLTLSVVLGISEVRRWRPAGAPRFAIASLHRSVSLLAVTLLVVHVATVLLDPFPRIGIGTAVLPFATPYRPLWTGMGTLALDALLAVAITSLVRARLGYRAWRGVHWLAYASWPLAVLHGLGTGSDARTTWFLVLTLACVAAPLAALAARVAAPEAPPASRVVVGAATVLSALGLAVWLPHGPLARGWARRAGTPPEVLAAFAPARSVLPTATATASTPRDALSRSFTAGLSGGVRTGVSARGISVVDLGMRLAGGPPGELRIRIGGHPAPDGGLRMDRSAVTLGPPSDPTRYRGRIRLLQDDRIVAFVGSSRGRALRLDIALQLGDGAVSGRLQSQPVGSAA